MQFLKRKNKSDLIEKTKLISRSNFSSKKLLGFGLVFAVIGGYFLYATHAAAPVVAVLEAESMTNITGATIQGDTSASGSKILQLRIDGTTSASISIPSQSTSLVLRARGDQCSGSPQAKINIDGKEVLAVTNISSTTYADYPITTTLEQGSHQISIGASNLGNVQKGKSKNSCSRILYVDAITLYGPVTIATPAPTVSLNSSTTTVPIGGTAVLTWTSSNATSCVASGTWTGTKSVNGTESVSLSSSGSYSLACSGSSGSTTATVAIAVSQVTPALSTNPLPYDMLPQATLKASNKKVFAHFFTPYPISIDNKDASVDYYTVNYLNPNGESGKHLAYGGLLRDRPLPRAIDSSTFWPSNDIKNEVTRATGAGLDGFTVDILGLTGVHWDRLNSLLQASATVDPAFKIVLMPDATSSGVASDPVVLANAMVGLVKGPYGSSVFKTADGSVVISPFAPEVKPFSFWQTFINSMETQGVKVAFVPCFLDYGSNAALYAPISYGFSNWGDRSPSSNTKLSVNINDAHSRGKIWMQPVSVQDERPRSGIYEESGNSENLRLTWTAAIDYNADWVQIPTWNDYSEGTEIAPSANFGWSLLDINGYYLNRFKSSTYPTIKRDTAYLSHRIQPYAALPTGGQTILMALRPYTNPARDTFESLTFLTTPLPVTLTINGRQTTYTAPAGLSAKLIPLDIGQPTVTISYPNGSKVITDSPYTVMSQLVSQDESYRFVSSGRQGRFVTTP